jgi:hypothetical protein
MAKDQTPQITVNYAIAHQPKETALVVPLTHWRRHVSNIRKCTLPGHDYATIGWSCVSASLGWVVAAVSLPVTTHFSRSVLDDAGRVIGEQLNLPAFIVLFVFLAGSVGLGIGGIVAIMFDRKQKSYRSDYATVVVEEMEEIETQHLAASQSVAVPDKASPLPATQP